MKGLNVFGDIHGKRMDFNETCQMCCDKQITEYIEKLLAELRHFKDTAIGLWATDRPELLTEEEKNKCFLFEIK